ncbi:MAG: hypothetical protein ACHBN1_04040 [Heteroscytonema crispum UTEX LB 1556]
MNHQPPTINHQPSTTNHQPSTINHQPSTINHQPSTINHQPPTTNHQPLPIPSIHRHHKVLSRPDRYREISTYLILRRWNR